MPSEEERQASLELLAQKKDVIEKTLDQRLFEERENEKALLKKAEAEFIQVLKDRAGELTEDEKNALDAACDEALEADLKKQTINSKARQMGFTETNTAYLKNLLEQQEQDLQSHGKPDPDWYEKKDGAIRKMVQYEQKKLFGQDLTTG